jgi:hypothetical protein
MTDRPTEGSEATLLEEPAARPAVGPWAGAGLCPFLIAADGDWRAASSSRDHRCSALEPPAVLSPDKQRRLCLLPEHATCATYLAARAYRGAWSVTGSDADHAEDGGRDGAETGEGSEPASPFVRWPIPRTAPVVIDRGRPTVRDVLANRSVTQLGLVLLMILAFAVLALARFSGSPGANGGAGSAPTAGAAASPTASIGATPAPSPEASAPGVATSPSTEPSPSQLASVSPAPSPQPSLARTYRVVAGDTLSGIAARFGVSLVALERANTITDPSHLRIGTVLVIP